MAQRCGKYSKKEEKGRKKTEKERKKEVKREKKERIGFFSLSVSSFSSWAKSRLYGAPLRRRSRSEILCRFDF